jgi:3-hydroxyisobutyrate dehydrogenase
MKAGFIGLGHIGFEIAEGLLRCGVALRVHDARTEPAQRLSQHGAEAAATPAETAHGCDILGICVRTDQQLLDVLSGPDGVLAGAPRGLVIAIHSTVRPATVQQAADLVRLAGASVVDAPVSRGLPDAQGRSMVYMVGGDPDDVRSAEPYLAATAREIVRTGGLGSAMTVKICNNLITYLEFVAIDEAMRLARRAGLDPECLMNVLRGNGNATPSMQGMIAGQMADARGISAARRVTLEGHTAIAEKDLDCALEMAADLGLAVPGATLARGAIRGVYLGAREGVPPADQDISTQ